MSTKYLDKTGLAYFWGKLKDYFQVKLVSGTNIKTINNQSILGSGNISISGGGGAETDPIFSASAAVGISSNDISSWNAKLDTETDPTVPAWAKASTKPSYTASEVGAVPTSRTVNSKALSSDITLTPSDLGAADYITQQNVTNGWTWRKWNSGIAEMWCTVTITAATNTSDAGGYKSASAATPNNFPFSFKEIPNVQVTCDSNEVTGSVTSSARPTTASAGSWRLYRNTSNTNTSNKNFMFYVVGKWK